VPPLFRYLRFIFDESSILSYCLKVHCTKGQVRNTLPGMGDGIWRRNARQVIEGDRAEKSQLLI
jgi:hypothetical protein